MGGSTRRGFLGRAGAVALGGVGPSPPPLEARSRTTAREGEAVAPAVNYRADGLMPSPAEHAKTLGSLAAADPDGLIRIRVDETQLPRRNEQLLEAFEDAHVHAA